MEQMKNAYNILAGNPEGKRLLRRGWEDNIKRDIYEMPCENINRMSSGGLL
jgi:hypothetical protein